MSAPIAEPEADVRELYVGETLLVVAKYGPLKPIPEIVYKAVSTVELALVCWLIVANWS